MCLILTSRLLVRQYTRVTIYGSRSKGRHKAYATESLFKLSAKVFSQVRASYFFLAKDLRKSLLYYILYTPEAIPSSVICDSAVLASTTTTTPTTAAAAAAATRCYAVRLETHQ